MPNRPLFRVLLRHGGPNNWCNGIQALRALQVAVAVAVPALLLTPHTATAMPPSKVQKHDMVMPQQGKQLNERNTCLEPAKRGAYRGYSAGRFDGRPVVTGGCIYFAFPGTLEANLRELLEQHGFSHYTIDERIACAEYKVAAPYTVVGESVPQLIANFLHGFPILAVLHKPVRFVRVEIADRKRLLGHCSFGGAA